METTKSFILKEFLEISDREHTTARTKHNSKQPTNPMKITKRYMTDNDISKEKNIISINLSL